MKCPSIVDVREIVKSAAETTCGIRIPTGVIYVPARAQWSIDSLITRIRATWMVWTGHADALTWPGQ